MSFLPMHRKAVLRSLLAVAVSNIFLQVLGFIYRIFLSRMTGAEGMGLYQLIMPFYALLSSITLTGLTIAVSKLSAEKTGLCDHRGARKCVSRALFCFTVALLAAAVISFSCRRFIGSSFLGDVRTLPSLPFLFVCLFLTGIENIIKNYFYGVGKVAPQITGELSEQIIRAVSVAALLFFFSPENAADACVLIICGMIISEISSSFILSLFFLFERRKQQSSRCKIPPYSSFIKIWLPISASRGIGNLLSTLTCSLIPARLRSSGLSPGTATERFGITFGMTLPLLSFPIAFIAALTSVLTPKISEAVAKGDFSDARRKACKTIHATSLLAMPFTAVMLPLGRPLGILLFENDCVGEFILPLSVATLLSYYELSFGAILNAAGKQTGVAIITISTGVLQLFFSWLVGIPGIGMRAFAVGSVISGGLSAALLFLFLCRTLRLSPRFDNWFFTPLLAAVLCGVSADAVYTLSGKLIIAIPLSLFSYLLALVALGTNPVKYIKTLIPQSFSAK